MRSTPATLLLAILTLSVAIPSPVRAQSGDVQCATAMTEVQPEPIPLPPEGLALALSQPARKQAAVFDIVLKPGAALAANAPALAAFERAAQQWEAIIKDPIVVTLDVDFKDLMSATKIGTTAIVPLSGAFDGIRGLIVADATSDADNAIIASLPTAAQRVIALPAGFTVGTDIRLTKPNLKALGYPGLDDQFGVSDGTIQFNSTFSFDFDRSNGVTPGTSDLETVAAHEIGHALGFNSSVDIVDDLVSKNTTGAINLSVLDLVRFANTVAGNPGSTSQFTSFARELRPGTEVVFDDLSFERRMSTGFLTGDFRQASHWKDDQLTGLLIGLMDPTLPNGTFETITAADRRALDLIGYDVDVTPPPTPTPSPSPTPTRTPTPTPTKTPVPTPSPSPSPSPTPKPSPSPTPSPSPSPSPTPSPTPYAGVRDDVDGDGKADVAVFESATGNWFAVGSLAGPLRILGFGGTGKTPVLGDFDGDTLSDAALYQTSTSTYSVSPSAWQSYVPSPLGAPAEDALAIDAATDFIAAPADYDGDGRTDRGVYNTVTGAWVYLSSRDSSSHNFTLGGTGHRAIPADFDGDGRADAATYEEATGQWKYVSSISATVQSLPDFGGGTRFAPVPADYDGDGKADQALYQKKKGKWRFRLTTTGTTSSFTGLGGTGWLPASGDFDGDGQVDAGAYRKSTGAWRYRNVITGVQANLPTLGGTGFVPVVGLRP